jgi:hypothetical protein
MVSEDGCIVFQGTGESVVAKEGDPLSIVEAKVAATVMAKADLLGKIKGAYMTSSVTVGDLMFASQEATEAVQGFIGRAEVEIEMVDMGRMPSNRVIATATLTLAPEDLANLEAYVE